MDISFSELIFLSIPVIAGATLVVRSHWRTPQEVVGDLGESAKIEDEANANLKGYVFDDDLASAGLISVGERRRHRLMTRLFPIGTAFICLFGIVVLRDPPVPALLATIIMGLSIGYVVSRVQFHRMRQNYVRDIEFHLPLVMERLVMAVEAGLDILPAVSTVLEAETMDSKQTGMSLDPVTRLLKVVKSLTESGLSFERALRHIAERIECSALRHTFVHLAFAQKEGGELIMPLRELSDATQLYYQETIEENIARMPVKATLPLVCTFAGLIIFFLTSPIIQVLEMMKRTLPE
ncbi:MAG: type II secretion system F family protein [Bdellovibrionales bacterium]|nr:type II secretion system F family protein [Bdellovibrionales bacterium]